MIELSGLKVKDINNPSGDIEIITSGLRPGQKRHEELLLILIANQLHTN